MRWKRAILWSTAAGLLAVFTLLAAALAAAFFLPWERCEAGIKDLLNRELPVRVDFAKPRIGWGRGLGITLDDFRILALDGGEGGPEILRSRRLVLRPALPALLRWEIRLKLLLDSPRVDLRRAAEVDWEGGEQGGTAPPGSPEPPVLTLSGSADLPAGLALTRVDLRIRNGSLAVSPNGGPGGSAGREVRELEGSLLLRDDLGFSLRVHSGVLDLPPGEDRPWSLAARVAAEARGRIVSQAAAGGPRAADFLLPSWLELGEARVTAEQAGFRLAGAGGEGGGGPGLDVGAAAARAQLGAGLSFRVEVEGGRVRWQGPGDGGESRLEVSGGVSGVVAGQILPGPWPAAGGPGPAPAGAAPSGLAPVPARLLRLPAWLGLGEVQASVRDGSLQQGPGTAVGGVPGNAIRELRGSVHLESGDRFRCQVEHALVRWSGQGSAGGVGAASWALAARSSALVSGRFLTERSVQAQVALNTRESSLRIGEQAIEIPDPVDLSVSLSEIGPSGLSASGLRLQGAGIDLAAEAAEARWPPEPPAVSLRAARLETSRLEPVLFLLPRGSELAGSCSVEAGAVSWHAREAAPSAFPGRSFHLQFPGNLAVDGFRAAVSRGRAALAPAGDAVRVRVEGVEASLEQKEASSWTAKVETAAAEISMLDPPGRGGGTGDEGGGPGAQGAVDRPGGPRTVRFSGAFSLQGQWRDAGEASHAVLVADLTGGRAVCGRLLDKPAGVPLQAGGRARFGPGEIQVAKAFLRLGETQWSGSGTLQNPQDPALDLQVASGTVSLDRLAELSPAAAEQGVGGLLEIQRFRLSGKTRDFKKTATVRAGVMGKELKCRGEAIEGLYAEGVYGEEILTVSPLIVSPGAGRVEATFTGDFSGAFQARGRQQYYGTAKLRQVSLDKIVTLAQPEYAGRVSGTVDMNAAGRATGRAWEQVRRSLEARARVRVQSFQVHGEGGRRLMERLAPGEASAGVDPENLTLEQRRLLSGNNASALVSLEDEQVEVRNLAATYEGKVVELDGTVDFSGRLHIREGSLFLKNRRIPFRLNCRLGQGACTPAPDLKEMGRSAGREIVQGMQTLSAGSRDVFKDLFFWDRVGTP